ncbi:unnamed protein product [Ectocarpus sp. 12 AP-2014]
MGNTQELVQVWGRRCTQHKYAIIFGSLTGSISLVPNFESGSRCQRRRTG